MLRGRYGPARRASIPPRLASDAMKDRGAALRDWIARCDQAPKLEVARDARGHWSGRL